MRRCFGLFVLVIAIAAAIGLPICAAEARSYLPEIGGYDGAQYDLSCVPGQNLIGLEIRHGLWIDAARPICAPAFGARRMGNASSAEYPWQGGSGGSPMKVTCPAETPALLGLEVYASGRKDVSVTEMQLFCGLALSQPQELSPYPSETFESPPAPCDDSALLFRTGCDAPRTTQSSQRCPLGEIAIGIHGRANGQAFESVGLICDAPRITNDRTGLTLGRAGPGGVGAAMSVCDRAKDARSRNSPVAGLLEQQCAKGAAPGGRVTEQMRPLRGSSISGRALFALARPSAPAGAVPGSSLDALEAIGAHIEEIEPLAHQLAQSSEVQSHRAYDIGLGLDAGNTAVSPAELAPIRSALGPDELHSFDVGTRFGLDYNRNANLAQAGAQVIERDTASGIQSAIPANADPRFVLGFEIAAGLFGSPQFGGQGNRQMTLSMSVMFGQLGSQTHAGFDAARRFLGVGQ